MQSRRQFLGAVGLPATAALAGCAFDRRQVDLDQLTSHPGSAAQIAQDEAYWGEVARAFTVSRMMVNLNNGGCSPSPRWVQDAMQRHLALSNDVPPYHMWRVLQPRKEHVRQRLARQFGVDTEEVAITRNTSEGLQTCQLGFDLEPGDEVLTTTQDYPRMITTFRQRERRDGIKLVQFDLPTPCGDPDAVVRLFEQHITPRTRLLLVSHVTFTTGQVLPVREVTALGRKRGIPVLVDGAHALAHWDFTLDELDCDYYATSLHKWLFAPHGTGLLYVARDKIKGLWPLMAAKETQDDDIRKFEEIGTYPLANSLAIAEALTFHQGIGPARKAARLVYLRDRWAQRLDRHDRVHLHTSLKPGLAYGIATVGIDGLDMRQVAAWLLKDRGILVTVVDHPNFSGMRVSPSVYTTPEEVDRFSEAIEHVLEKGLPGV